MPVLRDEYSLTLGQIGVVLATVWIGALPTLLPWGLAADRYGERIVLAVGLSLCAVCLVGAAYASRLPALVIWLVLAGAAGSSVQSASGRAVMSWFRPAERGLALGIRQTAVPVGGVLAALVLPALAAEGGSELAFLVLAGACGAGAVLGALVLRGIAHAVSDEELVTRTLRDARLWRLSLGAGIYVVAQVAVVGFGVVFLHDERGLSDRDAALVIAVAQVLAVGFRIGAGRWSDVVGSRIGPLRQIGLVVAASVVVTAALTSGPLWLLLPALALAGGLSMGWNGLAFAAAAELAGAARSGVAIGFQQSVLSAVGVAAPIVFATLVSHTSWAVAFLLAALCPLVGRLSLRPLRES